MHCTGLISTVKTIKIMDQDKNHYLPSFCTAEVVLKLVLMVEFTAIVFAILTISDFQDIYSRTGLISLFMLLVVISSTATLCFLDKLGFLTNHSTATAIVLVLFSFYTFAFTVWVFSQAWFVIFFDFKADNLWFVLVKFEIIALIYISIGLRYLFVRYESERQLIIQGQARLQALQARIRPHFLFNSMNTIASLVHDSPDQAEQATVNLSHLFRASLSDVNLIPLKQEIELTKDYIDLEYLRLEERLQVVWDCEEMEQDVFIPPLTLQPLVENAIYHGIEPMIDGGEIVIKSLQKGKNLVVSISNPLGQNTEKKQGNQMALNNIKERLAIAFKGKSTFKILQTASVFTVEISLPVAK